MVLMNATHFAGRLRELREAAGLTQLQLAEHVGVQRLSIARWETGYMEPSWSNVLALAAALGVTPDAFMQEPAPRDPTGPGRPPKATPSAPAGALSSPTGQKPKRQRSRPLKS